MGSYVVGVDSAGCWLPPMPGRRRPRRRRARTALRFVADPAGPMAATFLMAASPARRPRRRRPARMVSAASWRTRFAQAHRGLFRVFDDPEYRFHANDGVAPAEGDSPADIALTLPRETGPYADGSWLCSMSYFNGVIDSGFLPVGPAGETYLRLDVASGAEVGSPPRAPSDVRLEVRAGGVIRVIGRYLEFGSLRATAWAIAYTTDGSTPAESTPDVTVSLSAGGMAVLSYDLPAASHGTTVKVRVQTQRGTAYSEGSTVLTATADAQGPAAIEGGQRWIGRLPEDV